MRRDPYSLGARAARRTAAVLVYTCPSVRLLSAAAWRAPRVRASRSVVAIASIVRRVNGRDMASTGEELSATVLKAFLIFCEPVRFHYNRSRDNNIGASSRSEFLHCFPFVDLFSSVLGVPTSVKFLLHGCSWYSPPALAAAPGKALRAAS